MVDVTLACKQIHNLDLGGVRKALIERDGMPAPQAEKALTLYRAFLELAARHPDDHVAPPTLADLAWHHHMLDSQRYFRDCHAIFGGYLHHDPHVFGTDDFRQSWARTRDLFRQHFGVILEENPDVAGTGDTAPSLCYVAGIAELAPSLCYVAGITPFERAVA
ncbi:MAG TPA: hypothetical protein VEB64_00775 [Azospirillaceae bacterium]|nr:hypothetical protein [Azospirillaceae bacterium]